MPSWVPPPYYSPSCNISRNMTGIGEGVSRAHECTLYRVSVNGKECVIPRAGGRLAKAEGRRPFPARPDFAGEVRPHYGRPARAGPA